MAGCRRRTKFDARTEYEYVRVRVRLSVAVPDTLEDWGGITRGKCDISTIARFSRMSDSESAETKALHLRDRLICARTFFDDTEVLSRASGLGTVCQRLSAFQEYVHHKRTFAYQMRVCTARAVRS